MNGKGSRPRPLSIGSEEYAKRYEAVFGRKPGPMPDFYSSIRRPLAKATMTPDAKSTARNLLK